MSLKKSKYFIRGEVWHTHKWCDRRERTRAEEEKQYIRGKRRYASLPQEYDTQWIKKQKSWKSRVRKAKQWVKHTISKAERLYHGVSNGERQVQYLSKTVVLLKGENYIYSDQMGNVFASKDEPFWRNGYGWWNFPERMIIGITWVTDPCNTVRSYIASNLEDKRWSGY